MWRAEIVQVGKKSAVVRLIEPGTPARELGVRVSLVVSVLKGDKMDDVVRDAVMLGVTSIRPVVSERSEIGLAAMARGHADRALAADRGGVGQAVRPGGGARDSRCARRSTGTWLKSAAAAQGDVRRAVGGARRGRVRCTRSRDRRGRSDRRAGRRLGVSEVAAAHDSGAILMSLGGRTLRADAVPIVALTALLTTWGELK